MKLDGNRTIKFKCNEDGLYVYSPTDKVQKSHHVKEKEVHVEEIPEILPNVRNSRVKKKGRKKVYVEG